MAREVSIGMLFTFKDTYDLEEEEKIHAHTQAGMNLLKCLCGILSESLITHREGCEWPLHKYSIDHSEKSMITHDNNLFWSLLRHNMVVFFIGSAVGHEKSWSWAKGKVCDACLHAPMGDKSDMVC